MDYGYPQFTEAQILEEYIKTDAYKMEVYPTDREVEAYLVDSVTLCQWILLKLDETHLASTRPQPVYLTNSGSC